MHIFRITYQNTLFLNLFHIPKQQSMDYIYFQHSIVIAIFGDLLYVLLDSNLSIFGYMDNSI